MGFDWYSGPGRTNRGLALHRTSPNSDTRTYRTSPNSDTRTYRTSPNSDTPTYGVLIAGARERFFSGGGMLICLVIAKM